MTTDAFSRPSGADDAWLIDWFSPHQYTAHTIREILHRERSAYQRIEIATVADFGRCLVLNGEVQSFEADEFIYHEALVHPALVLHPDPRRVLIIGGGEGATLREVLRHRTVETAVMVDLDERVVEAAREHLPAMHDGAFDDERTRLVFGDGRAFVEQTAQAFDVVLVDVNNPLDDSPSRRLFTAEFHTAVRACLAPGGMVAVQSGAATPIGLACPGIVAATVRSVFGRADTAMAFVPSFAAGWTFVTAGRPGAVPLALTPSEIDRRLERRLEKRPATPLRYYDGACHRRLFSLPRYLADGLARAWSVSRDDAPIVERFPGFTPEDYRSR